ncbi:hypothetical protein C1N83_20045 [Priestia aryabhattai]|nr:hypothetical protein [Priestia aryabhattai]MBY0049035.1 hypothetical protein [Priestia aryabhattai]
MFYNRLLCRRSIIFHYSINSIKSHGRLVYFYIIYRNLKEKGEADIMAKIISSLCILLGAYALIVFIDVFQGNYMFQSFYNLKQYFVIARGEDYFLIVLFALLFVTVSIFPVLKKQ